MKSDRILSVALGGLSIFALHSSAATPIERSVSPSGQFIIYGGDAASRGAVSALAERTKRNLLAFLRRRDQWTTVALINLQSPMANMPETPTVAFRFSQTESGLKLQLDLTLSRDSDSIVIERELLRVILLEMIYRNHGATSPGDVYVEPPSWLMEGLFALDPNRDRASILSALSVTDYVTPLDEFLRERPSCSIQPDDRFTAYSLALVQLLVESGDGRTRLGRYIDNFAFTSNDSLTDLRAAFPQLAENDLEKIWKSKIASLKNSPRTDLLTFSRTVEKLADLLRTKFPAGDQPDKTLALEDLCQKKPTSTQRLALQKFSGELMLLATQANPVLRPVVQDYQQLAAQLVLGKNRAVAGRLTELELCAQNCRRG